MKDKPASVKEKALAALKKIKAGKGKPGKVSKQETLLDDRARAKGDKLR